MRVFAIRFLALCLAALLALPAGAEQPARWFEIEALNPGLGPAPPDLERTTPRGTLTSLVEAHRAGREGRAAHLLNLARIPEKDQAEQGPELARKLAEVIERRLWIDWTEWPARPDARVVPAAGSGSGMAGETQRSLLLGILDVNGRGVPLRLNRVKPPAQDAVWVFSRQTVEEINALHKVYGPGWFERQLPDAWRKSAAFSLRRWELAALPAVLAGAGGLFLILRWFFGLAAQSAPAGRLRRASGAARTPVALLGAAIATQYLTTYVIVFSAPISAILSPTLYAVIAIGATMAILRVIDSILDVVMRRRVGRIDDEEGGPQRDFYTSLFGLRRLVVLVAVVTASGAVLSELHVFESFGLSLLASAGVLTVILGIAGQTVLGNILASLQIALAKPIRIGDSVLYEDRWAYVEAINYTYVRLRTWDGRRLIVPVQYFISHPFENWSVRDAKMTWTFTLILDPLADAAQLREAFMELACADPDVMEDEMLKVMVVRHDEAGQHVRFYATAGDPSTAWTMHSRLRERMIAWVSARHPEWWARERVADVPLAAGGETRDGPVRGAEAAAGE